MTDVEVTWAAEDDAAVATLLSEWKGKDPGGERYAYLVARLGDKAVGVLEGHHDWGNWEVLADWRHLGQQTATRGSYVSSIYVVPGARAQGVGSALMDQFEDSARFNQSPVIVVWPDEDQDGRTERLAFFARRGFEFAKFPDGVREPWLMTKSLRYMTV